MWWYQMVGAFGEMIKSWGQNSHFSPSTKSGFRHKLTACVLEEDPAQRPIMSTPSSWTFSLQHCQTWMSTVSPTHTQVICCSTSQELRQWHRAADSCIRTYFGMSLGWHSMPCSVGEADRCGGKKHGAEFKFKFCLLPLASSCTVWGKRPNIWTSRTVWGNNYFTELLWNLQELIYGKVLETVWGHYSKWSEWLVLNRHKQMYHSKDSYKLSHLLRHSINPLHV